MKLVPRNCMREVLSCDMNGVPQSKVMCSGTPKWLIHLNRKTDEHTGEDTSDIRTASNQSVDLSMVVKTYWEPSEGGRGPMMPTWMCPKMTRKWMELNNAQFCVPGYFV